MDAALLVHFILLVYWPLLFLRLREHFHESRITRIGIVVSVAIGMAAAYTASMFSYFAYTGNLLPIMLAIALASIVLLFFGSGRTKVKLIILAAYLHGFWQMLPALDAKLLGVEVILLVVVILVAKFVHVSLGKKKRRPAVHTTSSSISDLWS